MYNFKPNTKESDKIVITDFKTGVVHNGSSIGKNKNSLASCVNFDFTIDGKIKRRKSFTLKFNDDGNTAKIYGMGIWNGTPIRYKNSYVQAEYSGVWTNIGSSLTSASSGLKKQRFIGMDCVETDSNLTTVTLTTGGDYKFVKTSTSMPANAYVGNYIYIQGVYRLIIANTTDTIYIDGNLGVLATSGTCTIHKTIKGLIFNTSSRLYYIDPKGTFINPTTTTITETRSNLGEANIEIYANRLFHTATSVSGSDINRIYFSELGVGNSFYGNNYINIPCKETIIGLRAFKDRLVIYTYKGNIYYLYGDTPDNFRLEVAVKLKGCISAESICEGHNMQFYASEEGIELLNMIDNGGVNETIPLSDIIKDEFFEYDLEDALGVVCNSKAYFIMPSKITGTQKVFVYDIASSTRLGTTIWYFYDNFIQSNISSGEITCIENLGGDLYICQGGDAYYEYTNNSDSQYVNLTNLYLETQRLNNGDSIRKKIWRRIKIDFTPVGRVTEFKIYASFDGGAYQLIKTSNLFEIQAFFTKISTDIKVKIEITQSGTISTSSILEFLRMEIEYEPITKQ